MKRLSLILLGVLLLNLPLSSQATGTITLDFGNAQTINVTAAQRTKLQRLLDDSNAARAAQQPAQAAQTMEQWLRAKLLETILAEIRQAEAHEQAEACQAFKNLGTNAQNQIKAALGDKSPCR
jgi:cell pole-organizing protein PopZ